MRPADQGVWIWDQGRILELHLVAQVGATARCVRLEVVGHEVCIYAACVASFERRLADHGYHARRKERAYLPTTSSEGVLG